MNVYCDNSVINNHVNRLLTPRIGEYLLGVHGPLNELSINTGGRVWIDNGSAAMRKEPDILIPDTSLHAVIRLLAAEKGLFLDPEAPFLNCVLTCGARCHGALKPVADESQLDFRFLGAMSRPLSDFATTAHVELLRKTIAARKSIIVGGATSSGKSTFLNAIINELVSTDARLVIIEDAFELQSPAGRNVVRRLATNRADLKMHVFHSLRTRPDWIVIGETRDRSAWDLLDASRTGHPALSTIHASSAAGILTRLMSLAGCDDQFVAEAIDLAVFLERRPTGDRTIAEIVMKQRDHWVTL